MVRIELTTLAFATIGWVAAAILYRFAARGVSDGATRSLLARWAVVLAACLSTFLVGLLSLDGARHWLMTLPMLLVAYVALDSMHRASVLRLQPLR